MSLINKIISFSVIYLLIGCAPSVVEKDCCPPQKSGDKIRLAVAGKTQKEITASFNSLNKIAENSRIFNFELMQVDHHEIFDLASTESIRLTGENINCPLVFFRADENTWNVITVELKIRSEFVYIIPPVTVLKNDDIDLFLSGFGYFYTGNFPLAYEQFASLKNKLKDGSNTTDIDFWIAAILTGIGKNNEAFSAFNDLLKGGRLKNNESKGAACIAFGKLFITEKGVNPGNLENPQRLFTEASELLRSVNSRYWAISQMELGNLKLFASSSENNEDLIEALEYFENAGTAFIHPKDELDIAHQYFITGKIYLMLSENTKNKDTFIEKAISNFETAQQIWSKYDTKFANMEVLAHEYEHALEILSE